MLTPPRPATADLRATLLTWGPIVAGLAFMYGPSFLDLFRGIRSTDEQAHGPIVLGVSCWLVWRNWPAMWARSEGAPTSAAGWPVVVFGLLLYIVDRSRDILLFEIGSLIWLLIGILLLMRGGAAVKAQWFPLFLMLFAQGTKDRKPPSAFLTARFRAVKSRFPKRGSCKPGSRLIAKRCLPTASSP